MISQQTIDTLRERVDIVALIQDNVKLTKRGARWLGLCPFHKEKTPSFNVNPERGFYHCFGCGASGDAIKYLRELEGMTFREAVHALGDRFGVVIDEDRSEAEIERSQQQKRDKELLYEVAQLAAHYFELQLGEQGHPLRAIAHAELEKRGLPVDGAADVQAALSAFRIGYAPYSWDGLARYFEKQGVDLRIATSSVLWRRGAAAAATTMRFVIA